MFKRGVVMWSEDLAGNRGFRKGDQFAVIVRRCLYTVDTLVYFSLAIVASEFMESKALVGP